MTNSSGALGSANLLTIRGISSIMGDNNPLYVIDGVPVYGTDRDANSMDMSGGSVPGIAMGGTGSDATIQIADVVIMSDNLEKINEAIEIARRTKIKVITNIEHPSNEVSIILNECFLLWKF